MQLKVFLCYIQQILLSSGLCVCLWNTLQPHCYINKFYPFVSIHSVLKSCLFVVLFNWIHSIAVQITGMRCYATVVHLKNKKIFQFFLSLLLYLFQLELLQYSETHINQTGHRKPSWSLRTIGNTWPTIPMVNSSLCHRHHCESPLLIIEFSQSVTHTEQTILKMSIRVKNQILLISCCCFS